MLRHVRQIVVWSFCFAFLAILPQMAMAQSAMQLPASHLIGPEELVRVLQAKGAKLLILNVGPRMLYQQAHIPEAEYIGPSFDPEGLMQLHRRIEKLPRNSQIVIYCGCCPWVHCPNVNPAYTELHKMGFTSVKVLKIDNNFGADWVDKKYPTVRE